ncbi:MAG: hypothetical protein AB7J47_09345 [Acidimicrobiia bacterium]
MVVAPIAPAGADPAGPTDYRSVIDAIAPAVDGVTVDVVGGDSFLRVRADPGHEVVVIGYWDEPYARITTGGSVEINQSSPSVLQNTSRYGVATDEAIDATEPPRWEATGDKGELVWHDHRSHWMAPAKATAEDGTGLVQRWELPLVVDGTDVVVHGSLYVYAGPTSLWWVVLLPALAAAVLLRRHRAVVVAALGTIITVGGLLDQLSLPSEARPSWAVIVLAALATVAALASALRRSAWWATPVLAGAALSLTIVGYLQRKAIERAHVPGPTPDWLVRAAAVSALGVGAVVLVSAVLATAGIRLDLLFRAGDEPIASEP